MIQLTTNLEKYFNKPPTSFAIGFVRNLSRDVLGPILYDFFAYVIKENKVSGAVGVESCTKYLSNIIKKNNAMPYFRSVEIAQHLLVRLEKFDLLFILDNMGEGYQDKHLVLTSTFMSRSQIFLAQFSSCELCGGHATHLVWRVIKKDNTVQLKLCELCYIEFLRLSIFSLNEIKNFLELEEVNKGIRPDILTILGYDAK